MSSGGYIRDCRAGGNTDRSAANDPLYQLGRSRVGDGAGRDPAAVPHDGDAVGYLEDLVQPMTDINHAATGRPQVPEHIEHAGDLRRG